MAETIVATNRAPATRVPKMETREEFEPDWRAEMRTWQPEFVAKVVVVDHTLSTSPSFLFTPNDYPVEVAPLLEQTQPRRYSYTQKRI